MIENHGLEEEAYRMVLRAIDDEAHSLEGSFVESLLEIGCYWCFAVKGSAFCVQRC